MREGRKGRRDGRKEGGREGGKELNEGDLSEWTLSRSVFD